MTLLVDIMGKVLFESGKISRITINRPEKHNALDQETIKLITAYVGKASANKSCRCIVITGSGNDAFCAGADVKSIAGIKTRKEAENLFGLFYNMRKAITESPKAVIAMINGYCLGGGNELAAACDLRIASIDAVFGQPEVRLGIIPGGGATYALQNIIGIGKAKEMILTGKSISSGQAMRIGLVNGVCEAKDLEKNVSYICNEIASCGPNAVALAKSAINKATLSKYGFEKKAFADSILGREGKEGTGAFLEHRKAKFADNK